MNPTTSRTKGLARAGLALAIAAAAGAAMLPVRASAGDEPVTRTTSQTSWSDNGDNVKVTTKDGRTEIAVNGKTLPADATSFTDEKSGITVTREGGHVTVTRHGEVVLRHAERPEAGTWMRRIGPGPADGPAVRGWRSTGPDGREMTIEISRPRVMVGVTMETTERDGRTVAVLQRVLDDLPAARAGLEAGDVVLKVNGVESSSPEDIRAAIRDLDPGDSLNFTIERDGAAREIALKVEAFDPAKFGEQQAWAPTPGTPQHDTLLLFDSDDARAELQALRDQVAALTAELTARAQSLAGAAAADAQDLTNQIAELTRELAARSTELAERASAIAGPQADRLQNLLRRQWGQLPNFRFENEDGTMRGFVVPAPAAPTPPGTPGDIDGRLERLNDRLDRLESLLERLLEEHEDDESR